MIYRFSISDDATTGVGVCFSVITHRGRAHAVDLAKTALDETCEIPLYIPGTDRGSARLYLNSTVVTESHIVDEQEEL